MWDGMWDRLILFFPKPHKINQLRAKDGGGRGGSEVAIHPMI